MARRGLTAILAMAVVAATGGGIWLARFFLGPDASKTIVQLSCDPASHPCKFELDEGTLRVWTEGVIEPLRPFRLLIAGEAVPETPQAWVRFDMSGMVMGYNRYPLNPTDDGFAGSVVLPVCTASRNDWTLTIERESDELVLPFTAPVR